MISSIDPSVNFSDFVNSESITQILNSFRCHKILNTHSCLSAKKWGKAMKDKEHSNIMSGLLQDKPSNY